MAVRVRCAETGPNFAVRGQLFVQRLIPDAVCIRKPLVNLSVSGGIAVCHQRCERPKKMISGGTKLRSYFSPFVDESSPNYLPTLVRD